MDIQHILVASDLSDRAHSASRHAAFWAQRYGARITLLNVDDLEEYDYPSSLSVDTFRDQIETLRKSKLEAEAQTLRASGCEVEVITVKGRPSECIPREARQRKADLVVMARFGMRSLPEQGGPPPTFDAVLENSTIPTLVTVSSKPENAPIVYKRIMAPTDFSPDSTTGLGLAIELAHRLGVPEVNVAHVLRTPFFEHLELPPQSLEHLQLRVSEDLEKHIGIFDPGDVEITSSLLLGKSPALLLARHGALIEADLVVLPTHGKDAARRLIGSTTRELAIQTHANTLILTRPRI